MRKRTGIFHPAFERVYIALEALLVGRGNDRDKFYSAFLALDPLTEKSFSNSAEQELYGEIMKFFHEHPPLLDPQNLYIIPAGSVHWQLKKRIKRKILRLFRLMQDEGI